MKLDEAIKYAEDMAALSHKGSGNTECEQNHRQLAEWLTDYKQLLGAIQDIKAEILCLLKSEELCDEYDIGCNDGLKLALSKIDKHISGKERKNDLGRSD